MGNFHSKLKQTLISFSNIKRNESKKCYAGPDLRSSVFCPTAASQPAVDKEVSLVVLCSTVMEIRRAQRKQDPGLPCAAPLALWKFPDFEPFRGRELLLCNLLLRWNKTETVPNNCV